MTQIYDAIKGASWFEKASLAEFIIVGAGGIGSWAAVLASRMNPKSITVIDYDIVEQRNQSGQFYGMYDVGEHKVNALYHTIHTMSGFKIEVKNSAFQELHITEKLYHINRAYDENLHSSKNIIIYLALDSMKARHEVMKTYEMLLHSENYPKKLIDEIIIMDIRLTADNYQIIPVRGKADLEYWKKEHGYSDQEVPENDCTNKQSTFMATMATSHSMAIIANYWDYKMLPKFISYSYNFNLFETL